MHVSLVDEDWYLHTAVLYFGVFNRPKMNFKIHTDYSGISVFRL